MRLIPISIQATPAEPITDLPAIAADVMKATAQMYVAVGFRMPWVAYLAVEEGRCVGTCAFKTPPRDGRVEIGYFTFPEYEGKGVATRMAGLLIEEGRKQEPSVQLFAQTLPGKSASTCILEKLGFRMIAVAEHPQDGRVWEWELPR
ncbi:MAG: GNAT family N-acetyltransferase [Gammaproteobacteria bacterium]|jgi:RimJ/RimL family protein N-acetyltransferase|nr:GNAT family N-acetyltransferase [Gammaproteobacteria bacterium]